MPEWIVTIVVALIAAGPGIYAILSRKRAERAEASEVISEAAVRLIDPLNDRLCLLEKRVMQLEADNRELQRQVRELRSLVRALWEGALQLSKQLTDADIAPVWNLAQYRALVEHALSEGK